MDAAYSKNGRRLHVVQHTDGSVLFDQQRVKLYDCSKVEQLLVSEVGSLASLEDQFGTQAVQDAVARLRRLSRLSDRLAGRAEGTCRVSPSTLWLNVTNACNLRCTYCYAQGGDYNDYRGAMSPELGQRAVDLLFELSPSARVMLLVFAGGEPLLNFKTVRATIEHAFKQRPDALIAVRILTNGTVLTDEMIDFLLEHPAISLQISIDGPAEVHDRNRPLKIGGGSHQRVLDNIERLRERGFHAFTVRSTVCHGGPRPDSLADGLARDGLGGGSFQPVMCGPGSELQLGPEQFEQLDAFLAREAERAGHDTERGDPPADLDPIVAKLREGKKSARYCGAGHSMLVVTPSGSLYPCPSLVSNPNFACGTLDEGMDRTVFGRIGEVTVERKPACRTCWARNLCGGGCAAQAYEVNGRFDSPDPNECDVIRARIRAAIIYSDLVDRRSE